MLLTWSPINRTINVNPIRLKIILINCQITANNKEASFTNFPVLAGCLKLNIPKLVRALREAQVLDQQERWK
jgi:hypothetical protein